MEYQIKNAENEVIAKFVNEFDRDVCLDALREEFPDCVLRAGQEGP